MQATKPKSSHWMGTDEPVGGWADASETSCWWVPPPDDERTEDGAGLRAPLNDAPGPLAERSLLVWLSPSTSPPTGGTTPVSSDVSSTGTPVALAMARA